MAQGKNNSRGFTLIAALLILVLLSGVAAGLLFMVTNESKMSGNDQEANLAYYGAESGMEKLTSDLAALYTQYQVPSNTEIQGLISSPPTSAMVPGMNYSETISYSLDSSGNPKSAPSTISSGSNQGLYAEITPMTLQVIATRPGGATANITRAVEVASIPVFQFGMFCAFDCSYHSGTNISFGGRVHSNGNLFLTAGTGVNAVFGDKISAYGQVIMDRIDNNASGSWNGSVYISTSSSGGCTLNVFPPTGTNCLKLLASTPGDASWSGGIAPGAGGANSSFPSLSSSTMKGYLTNALTGATNMNLPFIPLSKSCTSSPPSPLPCSDPISIIRKPLAGEAASSVLGSARLHTKAEIRILLADTENDLHPERPALNGDADDVQFVPGNSVAIPASSGTKTTAGVLTGAGNEFYGMAQVGANNWVAPNNYPGWASYPLLGEVTTGGIPANGQGAWMRIEYLDNATPAAWHGITRKWLTYGFSRQNNVPPSGAAGTAGADPVNPQAIIILQQLRAGQTNTIGNQNAFYPINFYDAREGVLRDANPNGCTVNGIMNAVELNVANLALWLQGAAPYAGDVGKTVNFSNNNGYILYFSDHRGMLVDPNPSNGGATPAGVISGESGLEDTINLSLGGGDIAPDYALEGTSYYQYSPEDVDLNGKLDNWGGANIGYGFGVNTNPGGKPNPYLTTACGTTGLANAVSGARHVLKLVAGGLGNLPTMPPGNAVNNCAQSAASPTGCGGFTVASENPVYVLGHYNTSAADPFWGTANNTPPTQTPHSAAAIIADAVTLLSVNWSDLSSMNNPTSPTNRSKVPAASTTYYRMAVAAGKSIPWPNPAWGGSDDGADGGVHNFLRFLEDWNSNNVTSHYVGSLASMYYSEYNTGTFKYPNTVYTAPARDYHFDLLFLTPSNLPPGTPEFQDIDSLSYHQNFTPQ
ncbi:MAG TPA: PilX N-terminal domain-containing pilus assembly protein [Candidatus Solibacter sp.]|nr:PilX N-terminal domain-containing pilus assembly protein [Candidatus Solibacter sp.]